METIVRARNFELTDPLRAYVDKKLRPVYRHLPTSDLTSVEVELTREDTRDTDHRTVAQVTIVDINGVILRAEERGPNPNAAVDAVMDTMDRRLRKYKDQVYVSSQAGKAGKVPSLRQMEVAVTREAAGQEAAARAEPQQPVVRVKRFPIKPMTVEEAAYQMELLGHDFYLFLNSETNQYNVLYRRSDGLYGLIQPELS